MKHNAVKHSKTGCFCVPLYHNTPSHKVIHVGYKNLTYCDFLFPVRSLSYCCRSSSRNCSEINVFLKPKIYQETCKVVWYSHLFKNLPQFLVIHTVKAFGIVNKAEVDVFQELSCLFYDPVDVGNLISGSSPFSKSSLNIWKFLVHVLLKPYWENFEHYFASM